MTTGLAIIFTQQGLLSLENAVPLIMDANIGTTATALLAMLNMDLAAKKTALSHFIFNVGGVLLFLPVLLLYGSKLNAFSIDPAVALANIHLAFNVATSLIFLLLIKPFIRLVDALLGEGTIDFDRLTIPTFDEQIPFEQVKADLRHNLADLLIFLRETYHLVTLSIVSNYRSIFQASAKRLEYVNFLEKEYVGYFSKAVVSIKHESDSRELLRMNAQFDYLFQIYDSIDDIFNTKKVMNRHYIELKDDILVMVRDLSSHTLVLFDDARHSLLDARQAKTTEKAEELQGILDEINRSLLPLLTRPDRRDAGALSNFVTYSRRLKDKLVNFATLADIASIASDTTRRGS